MFRSRPVRVLVAGIQRRATADAEMIGVVGMEAG
jgi:hypothetical protein